MVTPGEFPDWEQVLMLRPLAGAMMTAQAFLPAGLRQPIATPRRGDGGLVEEMYRRLDGM